MCCHQPAAKQNDHQVIDASLSNNKKTVNGGKSGTLYLARMRQPGISKIPARYGPCSVVADCNDGQVCETVGLVSGTDGLISETDGLLSGTVGILSGTVGLLSGY